MRLQSADSEEVRSHQLQPNGECWSEEQGGPGLGPKREATASPWHPHAELGPHGGALGAILLLWVPWEPERVVLR